MSREITGDAPDAAAGGADLEADLDTEGPAPAPPPGPVRPPLLGRRAGLVVVLAVAGLVAAGLVVSSLPERRTAAPGPTPSPTPSATQGPDRPDGVDLPIDVGLWAQVVPAGREGGDLTHVYAQVRLMNLGGVARRVAGVDLLGLGRAVVSGDTRPGDDVELPPQQTLTFAATVEADCGALDRPRGRVVVAVRELDPNGDPFRTRANVFTADPDPRDVLAPMCPDVEPGLRVAVAATGGGGDDITVRVVNHGNLSGLVTPRHGPDAGDLRLVSDPPLPYDLGPGEAVVATLRVGTVPGTASCPQGSARSIAAALFLEAETPYGFTEVTHFPSSAIETAVRRHLEAAGCPGRS